MRYGFLAASAAALALAACGGGGSGGEANQSSAGGDNMAAGNMAASDPMMNGAAGNSMAAAPGAVPATGQEYATMAAASDMFEIQSSRLAQQKAQNPQVKSFAQMLITDHEKSTADLKTAAQQAQPAITITPKLDAEQQANMQALQGASGAEFDRLYMQQQVPAHEKALAMAQGFAQTGDVASLKQHAQTVSGPVQRHLEQARQMQQQMSGAAQ